MKSALCKRILCAMLASLMLMSISACGGTNTGTESIGEVKPETDTTPPETEPRYMSAIPDDLDFNGYTIRTLTGYCDTFSITADDSADVVNDLIYKRNLKAQEVLNVELTNEALDTEPWYDVTDRVRTSVAAGLDEFDIVAGSLWFVQGLMFGGNMYNLNDAPYIDVQNEWWATEYIEGMTWNDYMYWLCGPMDLSYVGASCCIFGNLNMWESHFSEDIYDMIFDGKWTLEALNEYSTAVYQDLNGDGTADINDTFGFIVTTDFEVSSFMNGSDIKITDVDSSGNIFVSFTKNIEPIVNFWEKWAAIYNNNTTLQVTSAMAGGGDTNAVGNKIFVEGNCLFRYANLDASRSLWRDMEDNYAIMPMPKLDEKQESYVNTYRDWLILFGIPVTISQDGLNAAGAFMEFGAAYSNDVVIPGYMDDGLKNKYIRDERSVDVINLMLDTPYCNFGAQVYDFGFILYARTLLGKDDIASSIAARTKQFDQTLDKILNGEKISTAY